jgi:hypothetical protein
MGLLACVGSLVLLTILLAVVFYKYFTVSLPISGIFISPVGGAIEVVVPSLPAGVDPTKWAGRQMVIRSAPNTYHTAVCAVLRPVVDGPVFITSSAGAYKGAAAAAGWRPAGPSDRAIISLSS